MEIPDRLAGATDSRDFRMGCRVKCGRYLVPAFGKNFPAMALVQVVSLVEPAAMVEIEATAVVPEQPA